MKNKSALFTLAFAAAVFAGCVDVEKEVAKTPSVYWRAPNAALPEAEIAPERIRTDTIENSGARRNFAKAGTVAEKTLSAAQKLEEGNPLGLADLLDLALENNPQTRAYWFQAKSYAAQLGSAQSSYYPTVSVGAEIYRSKTKPNYGNIGIPVGAYYQTAFGPSAQINWLLFDFGRREALVRSAREALAAANFDFNQSIQDVALSVNEAYYGYYSAVGTYKAAVASLEDAKVSFEAADKRYREGVGNKQDMLNALANFRTGQFAVQNAQSAIETARANIANALGIRVGSNFKIDAAAKIPQEAENRDKVENLVATALKSRQSLLASYALLRKAESDVDAARRDFLPQISATASASYYNFSERSSDEQYQYRGGFGVSWSLFEGFARKYELLNARANLRAQAQKLKAAQIKIISDVWSNYNVYESSLKQVESARAALSACLEAYEATKTGYDNGVNSLTDLLNAQSTLSKAREQSVNADSNLALSVARLAHATGALLANTPAESAEDGGAGLDTGMPPSISDGASAE